MAEENDIVSVGSNVPEEQFDVRDFIEARKMESKNEAEQRRQLDIQRIKNLKSCNGLHPLQYFPKEIWMMILNELDPEDKYNVRNVHPLFRDLMESNKLGDILFPLVMNINTFRKFVAATDYHLQLKRMREVSKTVMYSYDRYEDENFIESIKKDNALAISGTCPLHIKDQNDSILKSLLIHLSSTSNHSTKRLRQRHLSVVLYEDDMQDAYNKYNNNLTSLLNFMGKQVWIFRLTLVASDRVNKSYCHVYSFLQKLLLLTPNTKWLEMYVNFPKEHNTEDKLETVQSQYPFPRLASLERFSYQSTGEFKGNYKSFHIIELILLANRHIKMLDLDDEFTDNNLGKLHQLIRSLPLQSFRCTSVSYERSKSNKRLEKIQRVVNFNWQLQTINLCLDYITSRQLASMITVLHFLENFPTLVTVILKLNGIKFEATDTFGYLDLPNLTILDIRLTYPNISFGGRVEMFFSMQFLLHCKKLKTLNWAMDFEGHCYQDYELHDHLKNRENVKMLNFRAGLRNLYESNVWFVFPELDNVCVEITKYRQNGTSSLSNSACKHMYYRRNLNMPFKQFMRKHQYSCSITSHMQHCVLYS